MKFKYGMKTKLVRVYKYVMLEQSIKPKFFPEVHVQGTAQNDLLPKARSPRAIYHTELYPEFKTSKILTR